MMKRPFLLQVLIGASLILFSCTQQTATPTDIPALPVVPSEQQFEYQQLEFVGFLHFTVNTFTDKEWGYGDEDPAIFNPTELNAEQWVRAAKAGGMRELILTAKHHDGFCLWPSAYTEHDIASSPYQNGEGDLVRELVEACRKHGLKVGLYLSPWDRNHADYGKPEYLTYYRNQLRELLTNYGEINEIWFDGANGGDGYYGGANEVRTIDRKTYYDWPTTIALVKELQPDIKIFSDAGPDLRWVGNEHGHAGETFWSPIDSSQLVIGGSDSDYLNTGEPDGNKWIIGQCDVSIRPGWFYHADQDSLVKSPEELLDIYYKSVGRNGVLLVNLPPDRRGLIHENDVQSLREFREILDQTFATNLANRAVVSTSQQSSSPFPRKHLTDGDVETYWAAGDSSTSAEIILEFASDTEFDHVVLQEPIRFGQRVSSFAIDVQQGDDWETVFEGTTIGYKRITRFNPVSASKIRVRILESMAPVALSEVGVY